MCHAMCQRPTAGYRYAIVFLKPRRNSHVIYWIKRATVWLFRGYVLTRISHDQLADILDIAEDGILTVNAH